jgi:hypothetical protein
MIPEDYYQHLLNEKTRKARKAKLEAILQEMKRTTEINDPFDNKPGPKGAIAKMLKMMARPDLPEFLESMRQAQQKLSAREKLSSREKQ